MLLLLLLLGGNNAILNRTIKLGAKFIRDSLISSLQLQEYPRKIIVIKVCVLRDDGAMFAVALNAASLALMNAGMKQWRRKEKTGGKIKRSEESMREKKRREENRRDPKRREDKTREDKTGEVKRREDRRSEEKRRQEK